MDINKKYALAANEGDSRVAQKMYIILHESGNANDKKDANAVEHEAQYMKNNYENAYATFFVGGGGKVYQIGEPGYVAWGALTANPYAPVQIELAQTADKATFEKDYATYIELARAYAKKYNIPLTLDTGGIGTKGIKSHQWVTNNYGGDHVDPYGYFSSWGITKAQLAKDLANGVGATNSTTASKDNSGGIDNVITAKTSEKGITVYSDDFIAYRDTPVTNNSKWVSDKITVHGGLAYFRIGKNKWIAQRSTTLNDIVKINYPKGYAPLARDINGKGIPGTNKTFKSGTTWKTTKIVDIPKIGYCYQVSTNQFIEIKYQVGSGFKG